MQNHEDTLRNLTVLENEGSSCLLIYLKIVALPALVYGYFILGYFGVLDFRVEVHSVVLIGLIFLVALLFARHNAEFGACYFKRHHESFRIELKSYIVKNLMRIGEHTKSNASFDSFIDEFSKRIRNDNYASVGAGIFPTMGILGTFVSIAMTMPDFSSQTSEALEKEISLLLTGVGTAFYVSIYGILLSLWWIFFEKRGLSKFDKAIEAIREESRALFWTKEEIEQAYLKENLLHFEKIGSMFERLSSNDFFEHLGHTIEEKFGLFDKMLSLEAESVRRGALHLKEGMQALADSQEKQRDLGVLHGHILDALHKFNETTKALRVSIIEERETLMESQIQANQALRESAESMAIQLQEASKHASSLHVKLVEQFIESLSRLQERLESDSVNPSPEVESLRESLRMIDAETEHIIQKLDALK
jgi:methyl-accepting chemotaxis protein